MSNFKNNLKTPTKENIFNKLKEAENVKLFCRLKKTTKNNKNNELFDIDFEKNEIFVKSKENSFYFDKLIKGNISQGDFFESSVKNSFFEVFNKQKNLSILVYGNSNSGKTYTVIGKDKNPGILPIIFNWLLKNKELFLQDQLNRYLGDQLKNYEINFQALEIYNNNLRDLVNNNLSKPVKIREYKNNLFLENLSDSFINDIKTFEEIWDITKKNKIVKANAHNNNSSRSHCIFILNLDLFYGNQLPIRKKIIITDLAGSERNNDKTLKNGTLKESNYINKSLFALTRCLRAMKIGNIIPFRDSKLTQILYDTFRLENNINIILNINLQDNQRSLEDQNKLLEYVSCAKYMNNEKYNKFNNSNISLYDKLENHKIDNILFMNRLNLNDFLNKQNEDFFKYKAMENFKINLLKDDLKNKTEYIKDINTVKEIK